MKKPLLLFSVFIISALSKPDDRTVSVAIETSFQFEPKDINNEKGIVTNIKSFIDKIYRSLEPAAAPSFRATPDKITISKFLTDLGNNVLNLTDENIHNVASILNKQLQEYKASSPSFNSIFSDPLLKKYIKKTVHYWSNTEAKELKKKLQKFMRVGDPDLQKLTSRLNTFYTEQDLNLFYNYTKKLNKYLRKKKNLDKLIKEWLDFSIFDRYNTLNATSKVKVMNSVRLLLRYFTGNKTFKAQDDSDGSLWSEHEEDVSGSVGDEVHKHHTHRHILKTNKNHKHESKNILNNEEDDDNKTTHTLQFIEKLLNNDLLGNFELYLSDENKTKQ